MKPFKSFAGLRREKPERDPLILHLPPPGQTGGAGVSRTVFYADFPAGLGWRMTCSSVTDGVSRCGDHQTDTQTERVRHVLTNGQMDQTFQLWWEPRYSHDWTFDYI